jgi:pimeloyl-ACP methyl ester carboxylesterase
VKKPYHPFKSQEARKLYLNYYDTRAELWPVESETMMVPTAFGETFVRVSGSQDAPPLVLLPGDTETSLSWIPQIEDFSKHYRVFAVDNIYDNGRSIYSRPIQKPQGFVDWLDELFTQLGLENDINLIGFSYGGWLSGIYAIAKPERLEKLVLISSPVIIPKIGYLIRAIATHLIPVPPLIKSQIYWERKCLLDNEEREQLILENLITDAIMAAKCFKARDFVSPTYFSDQEWKEIRIPVLFLVGEEVVYSADKAVKRINLLNPSIKTLVIPDACHDITHSQTDIVNREILDFL